MSLCYFFYAFLEYLKWLEGGSDSIMPKLESQSRRRGRKINFQSHHGIQKAWQENKSKDLRLCAVLVQSLTYVQLFCDPWTAAFQASLSFTTSLRLLKLMSIESVMPFHHLILCQPLLLLPSVFPRIRNFSNTLVPCIR